MRSFTLLLVLVGNCLFGQRLHADLPDVLRVTNVRLVYDDGQHNAFTDLIEYQGSYYLVFRSCPDGHMVHPSAKIVILRSKDLRNWKPVHEFQVAKRDTRDPHFLAFDDRLFVYTGTWFCGDDSPKSSEYDLNKHLGYAVYSRDGAEWSEPTMLEGTFGHYIWRASSYAGKAYLCGRRKHQFAMKPRGEGAEVESAMLVSEDGLTWKTHSLFQEVQGDETAFEFLPNGTATAIGRRGRGPAQLLTSEAPFTQWQRSDLDEYIGGPLLKRWGKRWLVGGRNNTPHGPKTVLGWLLDGKYQPIVQLPSGGDNSYPGLIVHSPSRATVSWYSSHEKDETGKTRTAIYMADLEVVPGSLRHKIRIQSTLDATTQTAYLATPFRCQKNSIAQEKVPLVISLHSWSGDLEQRNLPLENLVSRREWFCLQPNFRGRNDHPEACGSQAAQQDILDAVDWCLENLPIDPQRVYLTGVSGGGHMTMMMAARYPERWTAASAWVGISDLATWHAKHAGGKYGDMMERCCGGSPANPNAAREYKQRSPLHFLGSPTYQQTALDIAAGIHDGHQGSVPIRHSLEAFNAIVAELAPQAAVTEIEINQLSKADGRLLHPRDGDEGFDPSFNRQHYLRRKSHNTRITIFEGGHEGIATAAMHWFDQH